MTKIRQGVTMPRPRRPLPGMEILERLDWAACLSFTTYGVSVGIRVNDSALLERLVEYLPPAWKPSPSPVVDRLYSIRTSDLDMKPWVSVRLCGRAVELAATLEVEVELARKTPREILDGVARLNPSLRESLLFPDGTPRATTFLLIDGRPPASLDDALPDLGSVSHRLYRGAMMLTRSNRLEDLFEALESNLNLYVASWAQRKLFVHAGVVGWRDRAIVIPGRSFSGKSHLVTALVRAGALYYSDEYAVFDTRGHVHPYLKPLSLRDEGGQRVKKSPVEALGGLPGRKSLPSPVGLVIVSEYRAGAVWRPRWLTAGQALLALLSNTVPARRRPKAALAILQRVACQALSLEGERGEAEEMVNSLLSQVPG